MLEKLRKINSESKYPANSLGLQKFFSERPFQGDQLINPRVNKEEKILVESEVQGILNKVAICQVQTREIFERYILFPKMM